jgi:hypothetical protein
MSDVTSFSLFKRSNGYYYILFERDGRRQWKSTGCSVKADALKALTNLKELFKKSKPTAISLAQFSKVYLEFARATYSKATVDIARIALKHLLAIAGECLLLSVTPANTLISTNPSDYKTRSLLLLSMLSFEPCEPL